MKSLQCDRCFCDEVILTLSFDDSPDHVWFLSFSRFDRIHSGSINLCTVLWNSIFIQNEKKILLVFEKILTLEMHQNPKFMHVVNRISYPISVILTLEMLLWFWMNLNFWWKFSCGNQNFSFKKRMCIDIWFFIVRRAVRHNEHIRSRHPWHIFWKQFDDVVVYFLLMLNVLWKYRKNVLIRR